MSEKKLVHWHERLERHKNLAKSHKEILELVKTYTLDKNVADQIESLTYWIRYHEETIVEIEKLIEGYNEKID